MVNEIEFVSFGELKPGSEETNNTKYLHKSGLGIKRLLVTFLKSQRLYVTPIVLCISTMVWPSFVPSTLSVACAFKFNSNKEKN
jgi:hypothetical protein